MNKKYSKILVIMLLFSILCATPTSAAAGLARESKYISRYSVNVVPVGSGMIGIEFSILGTRQMSALGAESIVVYEKSGSDWICVCEYDRNGSGMVKTSSGKHSGAVSYSGTAGVQYKVSVTLFAEDSDGSDSRTRNYILTAS